MTGKVQKMKAVAEYKDGDTRVFTMCMPGPDGKEAPGMGSRTRGGSRAQRGLAAAVPDLTRGRVSRATSSR